MRKFKNEAKKYKIISMLSILSMFIAVCCLSIVYSALSSTLNISGNVSVEGYTYYYHNGYFYTDPETQDSSTICTKTVENEPVSITTLEDMFSEKLPNGGTIYMQSCYTVTAAKAEIAIAKGDITIKRYIGEKNNYSNGVLIKIPHNESGSSEVYGSLTLRGNKNCKITINGSYDAGEGGIGYAFYNEGSLTLEDNITVTNNIGPDNEDGGAIYSGNCQATCLRGKNGAVTITGNYTSGSEGAGVYAKGDKEAEIAKTNGYDSRVGLGITISGEVKIDENYLTAEDKGNDYLNKKSNLYLGENRYIYCEDNLNDSNIGVRTVGYNRTKENGVEYKWVAPKDVVSANIPYNLNSYAECTFVGNYSNFNNPDNLKNVFKVDMTGLCTVGHYSGIRYTNRTFGFYRTPPSA